VLLDIYAIIKMNASEVVRRTVTAPLINLIAVRIQVNVKNAGVPCTVLTVSHARITNAFGRVVKRMTLNAHPVFTVPIMNVLRVVEILIIAPATNHIAVRKQGAVKNV